MPGQPSQWKPGVNYTAGNDSSNSTNRAAISRRAARGGYTIVELLIVVSLMGILAALLLPKFEPSTYEQLHGGAIVITSDLSYARNLAVANDSRYTLTFEGGTNEYILQHSGTNTLLNVLPLRPYRSANDTPDQQRTYLAELPHLGATVEIVGAQVGSGSLSNSASVEFNSLGGLTSAQPVTIWLACGSGTARRYLPLEIAPVTGLVSVGEYQAAAP
jgi:prepilin-type N-terminal cleavage/methylation domain-containing protein